MAMSASALSELLRRLKALDYHFVTPTPETHREVLRRRGMAQARNLRDVLGWSLPFEPQVLPDDVLACLREADAVRETDDGLRATLRVSTLDDALFLHSAFPTRADDAVFFGPDTYRFARLLTTVLADAPRGGRLIDIGTGAGAGAVVAARAMHADEVVVTDINPRALDMARINLSATGVTAQVFCGPGLDAVEGDADVIIANPPFIADTRRTYRAGGDQLGARVTLDWALAGARRLRRDGRFILYSGSAIVDGRDTIRDTLAASLDPELHSLDYAEIDPDIFGSQLAAPAYHDVERIAAIGAVIRRRRGDGRGDNPR